MKLKPEIEVEVVFLSEDGGGRKSLPGFGGPQFYRPHIVMQDRGVPHSTTGSDERNSEHDLGVEFVEAPETPIANLASSYRLSLMYYPRVDYSAVQPGAKFTVREGGRIVGHGVVESRRDR
jgi:translation elongation factor EF-Tu-like GTPase